MADYSQVDPIHNIARHQFPVLAEPFLVDHNYDFVKELGQGQSMRRRGGAGRQALRAGLSSDVA